MPFFYSLPPFALESTGQLETQIKQELLDGLIEIELWYQDIEIQAEFYSEDLLKNRCTLRDGFTLILWCNDGIISYRCKENLEMIMMVMMTLVMMLVMMTMMMMMMMIMTIGY